MRQSTKQGVYLLQFVLVGFGFFLPATLEPLIARLGARGFWSLTRILEQVEEGGDSVVSITSFLVGKFTS